MCFERPMIVLLEWVLRLYLKRRPVPHQSQQYILIFYQMVWMDAFQGAMVVTVDVHGLFPESSQTGFANRCCICSTFCLLFGSSAQASLSFSSVCVSNVDCCPRILGRTLENTA